MYKLSFLTLAREAMSRSEEADDDNLQFEWGEMKGIDAENRDVQFYQSFTYDNVEYSLYDCVKLFKEGETEPYIGKILNIWENTNSKLVEILWFFLPFEISNYLGGHSLSEKEIFLASGEGAGLSNVNSLEAICGKCSVICTSRDRRNRQPTREEVEMADHVFYRVFDVGSCTISDNFPDKIAKVDVRHLLNQKEDQPSDFVPKDEKWIDKPIKAAENTGKITEKYVRGKPNSAKDIGHTSAANDKLFKKMRLIEESGKPLHGLQNSKNDAIKKLRIGPTEDDGTASGKIKHGGPDKDDVKAFGKIKQDDKRDKSSHEFPHKASPGVSLGKGTQAGLQTSEVATRPNIDRSNWFKVSWEVSMQMADERGKLVLLDNLDPSYTSAEIQEIIYHTLGLHCTVKVVARQATFESPHYGKAYVIFKTRDEAEHAVRKINGECLMLPNGRPLVSSIGMLKMPSQASKYSKLTGHLSVDKIRTSHREEMKRAMSTSHCSQPNTLEYEMAMEWVLEQEKLVLCLDKLYKKHGAEREYFKRKLRTQ